jgi:hypothetical protein
MPVYPIVVLLSILVAALIGLIVWGFLRIRQDEASDDMPAGRADILAGLLIAAGFALGVALTYLLFRAGV